MRKRFIQSQLSLVDLFLAPSLFLLERYVAWGIPREKIRHEPNGRPTTGSPSAAQADRPRTRLAYFGQFTPYKGATVLLKAMRILANERRGNDVSTQGHTWAARHTRHGEVAAPAEQEPHLWLYGANLELQPGPYQNEFRELLEETRQHVTLGGRYAPAILPTLMASIDWVVVPSVWWENAPLVIQEAFEHGRPVICSDIGGMAEHVSAGVNGLHFRVGDPLDLARVIRQATATPGLWEQLRAGIRPVYRIENHVAALSDMYKALLERQPVAV
jgi:glycosyltransferase involved in cell wall biosynthesis